MNELLTIDFSVNVAGMPELFHHWLTTLPGVAFHMDTTTPLQLTRTYVDYLWSNFPLGSLEMRPINISEPSAILDARQQSLERLFQTFPQRKFGAAKPNLIYYQGHSSNRLL
jgi:phosphatidate phosphatase APP1